MKEEDENWLLSSISEVWNKVREDVGAGYIWTESDIKSSFYRHLVPLVEKRNLEPSNNLGNLRVLTELRIQLRGSKIIRRIDLAICTTSNSRIPEPSRIIAPFEFKSGYDYRKSSVGYKLADAVEELMACNENWLVWGVEERPATTEFVVLGLVADDWDKHTWVPRSNSNNGRILYPNGEDRFPRLEDLRAGLRYFEMHGPFSTKQSSPDFILGEHNRWGFFEITRDGQKREIS